MSLLKLITFRQQALDPAQAFISAAGITDSTQQAAITQLVSDLKSYNLWDKMKAVYPFVGGTATTHKYNLKDPRDLDAAFRLSFINSWTHDSDGAQGNSTNGYADTFLNSSTELSTTSTHLSAYSFLDINNNTYDLGNIVTSPAILGTHLGLGTVVAGGGRTLRVRLASGTTSNDDVIYHTVGFFVGNREPSSTNITTYQNGTLKTDFASPSSSHLNETIILGSIRFDGSVITPSNRKYSFVSIGDGLSATEVQNLTTAVNSYQQTLGRFWVVSGLDADAENFIYAAGIIDSTQQSAVNQLVLDLKSYGLWSKMLAIYPAVGGHVIPHSYNLKNPNTFRLIGGGTDTANGFFGQRDTQFNPVTESLSASDCHISYYSRSAGFAGQTGFEIGAFVNPNGTHLGIRYQDTIRTRLASSAVLTPANTDAQGFYIGSRLDATTISIYKNGSSVLSGTAASSVQPNLPIYINGISGVTNPNAKECAFASIGLGLDATEASNFYTAVQAFQTALGRQV